MLLNKIDHHSVSSVQLWADCPKSWWSKYVLDLSKPSSAAASFGSQYDSEISRRLGIPTIDRHTGEPIKPPEVLMEGVDEAVKGYFSQPDAFLDANKAQGEVRISPEQWAIFGELHGVCVEIKKDILGYVDLENPLKSKLVDIKTSKRAVMQAKWAFQVLIYSLERQYKTAEIHLMTTTKVPAWYNYPIQINEDTLRWAILNFTFYANQIEAALESGNGENLAANPDYYCSWCPVDLSCVAARIGG